MCGGDEENRTPDPLLARQVLSQLSYTPMLLLSLILPFPIQRLNSLTYIVVFALPCLEKADDSFVFVSKTLVFDSSLSNTVSELLTYIVVFALCCFEKVDDSIVFVSKTLVFDYYLSNTS